MVDTETNNAPLAEKDEVPIIESIECLMNKEDFSKSYEEYKKTDTYQIYFNMISTEHPEMSAHLIDLAIFGYFYESVLEKIPETERGELVSILEQPEFVPEKVKGDIPDMILSYDSYEDYLVKNPNVKPIPTIGSGIIQMVEDEPVTTLENEII